MKHILALRSIVCVCAIAFAATACDGCSEKKAEKAQDLGAPKEQDQGVAKEQDLGPKEDPLKEAKESAEKEGQLLAVTLGDTARLAASQIEAAQKKPTSTTTKTRIKTGDEAKGSIAAADANRVFRRFDGAMRKCYERALKKRPGLEGKVKLLVVVNTDGTVKSARASGISLKDSGVNNCMEALTPRMKFPKPKGGIAKIQKVYSFSPAI